MLAILTRCTLVLGLTCALPAIAGATQCQPPGGFDAWLASFKQAAAANGISQQGLAALNGITYDPNVVARDRGQGVFKQSFEEFSGRMVPPRLNKGANMLRQYAGTLTRIEQQFGVPGSVLVAIWGLETDYGANVGKFPTIRALASLAYDCRRTDMFQAELMDALRIVERGDLTPAEMHGAWAGEIGQTQFMPSAYLKYAVNVEGGGGGNLMSPSDALASTANFLRGHGWQPGSGWDEGQPNFPALLEWNSAPVYAKTIALLADKLAQP